ncbi:MAG: peptide chain release factor 1 [Thermoplasmata archaeon]|nr:peptide chain release factor 1 [Thermoplasmata archaeon]TFG67541.1 MAG: peptide chain release factor 1 [Methanomassiliicoccus sp.]
MTELTELQKYEFRRSLEEVEKISGRGTELISLYIPPTRQISDVAAYLRNEYSQSSNIKSASTRKNVQAAISSILSRLKGQRQPPGNGLVFFVGHKSTSADQTSMVQYSIEPPDVVQTFIYRCDSGFFTEPLIQMLEQKDSYGLIVIDRGEATIGLLHGKRIIPIKNIPSLVPSKHGRGGQSARRFERLIEIAAHEFYTKVADVVNESFLTNKNLKGVLIGGPGPTKEYFVKSEYLHYELQNKIIDTFDVGYTDEYGLRELVEKARDALKGIDLMREKNLMQRLFEEIRKADGGLSIYGEEQVRNALMIGAVDALLLSEDMRRVRLKLTCPSCGFQKEAMTQNSSDNIKCDKCQTVMRADDVEDLVEELHKTADANNTKVEFISGESEEGELLKKAFGGIAGILRFRVN